MTAQFSTIGHSNRTLPEFASMLQEARVELVVDVRAFPRSRSNPAFNIDSLPRELAHFQIGYRHMPLLGGRRPRQANVDEDTNALWRLRSFHNYADYALGGAFQSALAELLLLGRERRLALMCAEAVWWRCHRRLVSDHLLARGIEVRHIMPDGELRPHVLTEGAVIDDGDLSYPPPQADRTPTLLE